MRDELQGDGWREREMMKSRDGDKEKHSLFHGEERT